MKIAGLIFCLIAVFNVNAVEIKKTKIVFLGDSLTAGYGVDAAKAYPMVLAEKWKVTKPQVEVMNSSISGSTTAGSAGRLKWILKNPIQVLVVALGANDGLRGFQVATTRKNLEELIELAQKNKIKVVLAGMQLPLNYGQVYRKEFETMYDDLTKKYSLVRIPFLLKDVGGEAKMNIADGIHPNEKGHEKIAATVAPFLEKLL